ncbi:hypothetical protein C0995_014917, partial [Termitomyces sp. Mi166
RPLNMVIMAILNMLDLIMAASLKSMVIAMTIKMLSHIIPIFPPNTNAISMWKSVPQWMLSNTFTNTFTKAMIRPLWKFLETKEMKSRNTWMPDTFLHWRLAGTSMNSTCMQNISQSIGYLCTWRANIKSTLKMMNLWREWLLEPMWTKLHSQLGMKPMPSFLTTTPHT